jgi:hypothetical protein
MFEFVVTKVLMTKFGFWCHCQLKNEFTIVNRIWLSDQESISPINLRISQRQQHKVNGAKAAVLFHLHFCQNFIECFWLQFFCQAPYFSTFLLNDLAI